MGGGLEQRFRENLLKDWVFRQCGAKKLISDSAVYYIQEPAKQNAKRSTKQSTSTRTSTSTSTADMMCNDRWFILISHTDDFAYQWVKLCGWMITHILKNETKIARTPTKASWRSSSICCKALVTSGRCVTMRGSCGSCLIVHNYFTKIIKQWNM